MNTNHFPLKGVAQLVVYVAQAVRDPDIHDPVDSDPCLTSALIGCCGKGGSCCGDGCCNAGYVFRNTMAIRFLNELLVLWDAGTPVSQSTVQMGAARTAKNAITSAMVTTPNARFPVTSRAARKTSAAVSSSSTPKTTQLSQSPLLLAPGYICYRDFLGQAQCRSQTFKCSGPDYVVCTGENFCCRTFIPLI